jgi:hypothetical protein
MYNLYTLHNIYTQFFGCDHCLNTLLAEEVYVCEWREREGIRPHTSNTQIGAH